MAIRVYSGTVTTTGSAGSATGSTTVAIPKTGYLEWIKLNYSASAPAGTTDVTIADGYSTTVYAKSNSATDVTVWPRMAVVNAAATAISNEGARHAIASDLTVTVAQCDALAAALVVDIAISDV